MGTRFLYLARHGEALPDESGLTDIGRHQATLLGERLRNVQFTAVHHGPLPRAKETAKLIAASLGGVPVRAVEAAGDYVPHLPSRDELPEESAEFLLRFLEQFSAEDLERGAALAKDAEERFTGPVDDEEPRHDLVITHNFLIGWLVRQAMDAPDWRWLGLNQCHAALTVIRYAPERPASVLCYNDLRHLPEELQWTGFPAEMRV